MSITNNEYECNTLIVEISYGFGTKGIDNAPGYWDSSLQWHEGKFNPQGWMVEELMKDVWRFLLK